MSAEPGNSIHQCRCTICQTDSDAVISQYHEQINLLLSRLNEAQRRWYVGTLSQTPDGPSIRSLVAISGLSSNTILRGRREILKQLADVPQVVSVRLVVANRKPKKRPRAGRSDSGLS